jgi:hypothetical protein
MKSIKFGSNRYVPWWPACTLLFIQFFLPSSSNSQYLSLPQKVLLSAASANPELRLNEINSRASRHFKTHFSPEDREKWIKEDNFYIANFKEGRIRAKAYYDLKGWFAYCMKTYSGNLLTGDIRSAILQKFAGYAIDVVNEITDLEHPFYLIKIKSSTNIKTLRVLDGNVEVLEDFSNGSP